MLIYIYNKEEIFKYLIILLEYCFVFILFLYHICVIYIYILLLLLLIVHSSFHSMIHPHTHTLNRLPFASRTARRPPLDPSKQGTG